MAHQVLATVLVYSKEETSEVADTEVAVGSTEVAVQVATDRSHLAHHQKVVAFVVHDHTQVD